MPIKSSGTLSFSNIRDEAGPAGTSSVSLSSYRGAMAGIPLSGPIEMSDFYGKTFFVTEIITEDTVWSPKINFARFIHIFVVGAGGSGGAGWPLDEGIAGGVAGGAGGGAGGVSYSKIAASSAGSSTITIGVGGAGVSAPSESRGKYGNSGSSTTFVGSGLNMTANGGGGGPGSADGAGFNNEVDNPGGTGGTASNGNLANYTGGSGGRYFASNGFNETRSSASGGGAVRFANSQNGTASNSTNNTTTPGIKVSNYTDLPAILSTYITGRSQTPVLSSSITDFDASDGSRTGSTASPKYGSGSGGCGDNSSSTGTGDGGDGIVIIVYEI